MYVVLKNYDFEKFIKEKVGPTLINKKNIDYLLRRTNDIDYIMVDEFKIMQEIDWPKYLGCQQKYVVKLKDGRMFTGTKETRIPFKTIVELVCAKEVNPKKFDIDKYFKL